MEVRPLKKDAGEIYGEFLGHMNTAADRRDWQEYDRLWKAGVLQLLAKIGFELERQRGHE